MKGVQANLAAQVRVVGNDAGAISPSATQIPGTEDRGVCLYVGTGGSVQVAPQETEVESYMIGGIKQNVKKETFSGFQL